MDYEFLWYYGSICIIILMMVCLFYYILFLFEKRGYKINYSNFLAFEILFLPICIIGALYAADMKVSETKKEFCHINSITYIKAMRLNSVFLNNIKDDLRIINIESVYDKLLYDFKDNTYSSFNSGEDSCIVGFLGHRMLIEFSALKFFTENYTKDQIHYMINESYVNIRTTKRLMLSMETKEEREYFLLNYGKKYE